MQYEKVEYSFKSKKQVNISDSGMFPSTYRVAFSRDLKYL